MAIRRNLRKRFKGVNVRSGHIYKFKYSPWENDPEPIVIMMYALEGINTRADGTKHQWRFFQAINFTYIPRSLRKKFAFEWQKEQTRSRGNAVFTWEKVKSKYPYLQITLSSLVIYF